MTSTNDDDRGGRRPGRPPPRRPSGERPFRSRDDRPPRSGSRDEDRPPRRGRAEGGDRFAKPREHDRPFRARSDDKPRPPRGRGEDAPRGPRFRDDAERPFRKAPGGEDRPRRPRSDRPAATPAEPGEERIAKAIARAGLASRRDAEAMIAEGRVTLNGTVLESPAVNVTPADAITVDGEPLPARERTRLWIFHKPRGLVTTARDPEGRPTVFEQLPEDMPRVVAIGRLDINTEGLLLLTNDGGLAKVIAHPSTGWLRRYRVRAHGDITQADLDKLRGGITVDEMDYGPVEASLDRVQGDNVWITLGLREGKNREVKKILEHLGLQVNRLIRLSFGPFQLGDLEPGLVEELRTKVLKDQLGQKLAEEAGVDFESPVREPIAPFGRPAGSGEAREGRPRSGEDERVRPREDRPRFGRERDEERPFRPRERNGRAEPRERTAGPGRPPRSTVWRGDEDSGERRGSRVPRRGADAKAARTAAGERPRERVGAIAAGERKVLVERLVSSPRTDESRAVRPPRPPRREAPGGEERPRRDERRPFPGRAPRPGGFGHGSAEPRRDGGPSRAGPRRTGRIEGPRSGGPADRGSGPRKGPPRGRKP